MIFIYLELENFYDVIEKYWEISCFDEIFIKNNEKKRVI